MPKDTTDKIDSRDLPALISAVMKHPDTPALIYNALKEALTDMSNRIDYQAPEMIQKTLTAYTAAESSRQAK